MEMDVGAAMNIQQTVFDKVPVYHSGTGRSKSQHSQQH